MVVGSKKPSKLTLNSKEVTSDALFLAVPGLKQDGSIFIKEALEKGANTIIAPETAEKESLSQYIRQYPKVSFYLSPNVRKAASCLASCFYPKQPDCIVAVTGTNGKTSISSFIRQIWHHQGKVSASLGNLGLIVEGATLSGIERDDTLNTPDPIKLHQMLHQLKEEHIDYLAFEASSHGLDQYRLDGVKLKAAVFSNLTNDHLDYHHTMEAYFEAKCRLFKDLLPSGCPAILNKDIPQYQALEGICKEHNVPIISYGKEIGTVQLVSRTPLDSCQVLSILIEGKHYELSLPLVGEFQAYNVMAALGAHLGLGEDIDQAAEYCQDLKEVPGRLQQAVPSVYVDFAHTPDALSMALQALRPHTKGDLWVVFGCGGDRDATKRPIMGEVAARYADKVIVTDDNPRYESPKAIRKEIISKCPHAIEACSRREAIEKAVTQRKVGDVILIAGKGHEAFQIVKDQMLPFNDVDVVKEYV